MRAWIVFLQITRDDRRWEERAARNREILRVWWPAFCSRAFGPYMPQLMYPSGLRVVGILVPPSREQVDVDRWL